MAESGGVGKKRYPRGTNRDRPQKKKPIVPSTVSGENPGKEMPVRKREGFREKVRGAGPHTPKLIWE